MAVNLHHEDIALLDHDKYRYLRRNPGFLSKVACQLGISRQAVWAVFRGLKRSKRVERVLRGLGAPGFEIQKKKVAA